MNRKWWIPVHIILLFWIESLFVNFSPDFINNEIRASIPRFLFLYFIFISVYYDRKLGVLLVFVGIVMDVVFQKF